MSESAINGLRKRDFVKKDLDMKNKVVVGNDIHSLCTHVKEPAGLVNRYLWKSCNELQRNNIILNVFCQRNAVVIKISEKTLPLKIFHLSDIPVSHNTKSEKYVE